VVLSGLARISRKPPDGRRDTRTRLTAVSVYLAVSSVFLPLSQANLPPVGVHLALTMSWNGDSIASSILISYFVGRFVGPVRSYYGG
jgi:hypothetical protein